MADDKKTRTRVLLTDTKVRAAKAEAGVLRIWDSKLPGFLLRVTPAGSKSFCVRFQRPDGTKVDVTLGPAKEWSVEAARARAQKLRELHDEGKDARAHVQEERNAKDIAALAKLWKDNYRGELKPSSRKSYDSILKRIILPGLGTRLVKDLDRAGVMAVYRKEASLHPIGANRMITVLSRLMNIAEEEGWKPPNTNPCFKFKKRKEKASDRVLTAAELARLEVSIAGLEEAWEAEAQKSGTEKGLKSKTKEKKERVGTLDPIAADLIRFLALSGLRTSEAANLKWRDIDLDKNLMVIKDHKTSATMGDKTLPLNPPLREIIQRRNGLKLGALVFPGLSGKAPIKGLRKMWLRILAVKGCKLDDVTPHDLRRTFASTCTELGHATAIADTLLGHSLGKITSTYVRLSMDGVLSQASRDTALWIVAAMQGENVKPGVKVEIDDKTENGSEAK